MQRLRTLNNAQKYHGISYSALNNTGPIFKPKRDQKPLFGGITTFMHFGKLSASFPSCSRVTLSFLGQKSIQLNFVCDHPPFSGLHSNCFQRGSGQEIGLAMTGWSSCMAWRIVQLKNPIHRVRKHCQSKRIIISILH